MMPRMNGERVPNGAEPAPGGAGSGRNFVGRALMSGVSILPVALAGCLLLSWAASVAVPLGALVRAGAVDWIPGAAVYLVLAGFLVAVLRRTERIPEHRVVWALIGASAVWKLLLAGWAMRLPLHADQELFHLFVRTMADHRLDPAQMGALSGIYDYPVWAGRVLPVHYAMRWLAGARDVFWVRLLNVVLSSGILAATYGLARRLLPEGQRKWAVFLLVVLPFQTMVVTDYSHHLFSSFYFLVSLWCVWEMVFSSPGVLRWLGLSLGTAVCLLLMMGQRGTHWIALAVWAALLLWALGSGTGWRRWCGMAAGVVAVPLILSVPLAQRYDAWLAGHDAHRLNSVLPAFVARGWCPESDGEYCGRYEQLDRVTPWPAKSAAMFRLVGSQIRYNPAVVCLRFPVVKTAKLFLVGYASNFEESLAAAGSRVQPWARGMRWAAAPFFLGLAIWGCVALLGAQDRMARWLPVVLAPLVTWGAYVFFGETSPRYSIFCQPFLALLGARGWAALGDPARRSRIPWRPLFGRGLVVLGALAVGLGGLAAGMARLPAHWFYGDLQHGWTRAGGGASAGAVEPGALLPFEARLGLEPGEDTMEASWQVPSRPAGPARASFYLLDASAEGRSLVVGVKAGGDDWLWLPLAGRALPQYAEVEMPPGEEHLRFALRTADGGSAAAPARVGVGYVVVTRQDADE